MSTTESAQREAPALLRQTELRRFLREQQLETLQGYCSTITRRTGATLFRQEEPADALYLLVEGAAELRAKPPGRRVYRTVELIGPGCTLGDEAVFGEGSYLFSARTLEPAKLLVLGQHELGTLFERHTDVALGVLRCAGSCLEEIVRRSAILTQAPADVALEQLLRELSSGSNHDRNGRPVPVRMTHAQLAGVLHLSRETVSRMLARMATQGRVDLGRGVIRVH